MLCHPCLLFYVPFVFTPFVPRVCISGGDSWISLATSSSPHPTSRRLLAFLFSRPPAPHLTDSHQVLGSELSERTSHVVPSATSPSLFVWFGPMFAGHSRLSCVLGDEQMLRKPIHGMLRSSL
ncbi:hypothetical protein SEVIR_5G081700v4 [Setaria viridis]|uniref:Secreted protein n=1 Tax=Setaria viridis TaxID=4556 RepID=A0A4U6UDC4_SETVI|nr:hypothetical protein SEVIR_5G081700v2 [Setaria viridis]